MTIDLLKYERYLVETPEGFVIMSDAPDWVMREIKQANAIYQKEYGSNLVEIIEARQ